MLALDIIGHLSRKENSRTLLWVVVVYFTKWVELFAFRDAKVDLPVAGFRDFFKAGIT
jgi:hypothetical protein